MLTKWDSRFLKDAKEKASWSKDPSKKIGSVAVGKHKNILATGYNGFPRGITDSEERYNNREVKYQYVIHSEMNLIFNACLAGVSLEGATLYVYGLPVCSECAKGIIQVGITRVISMSQLDVSEKWVESNNLTKEMFKEAGVEYYHYFENISH